MRRAEAGTEMGILKKAVSASGPIMRVLIGGGAFALLIFGLKEKSGKDVRHTVAHPSAPETKTTDY